MKLRALFSFVAMACISAAAQPQAAPLPDDVASWLKAYTASRTTFDGKRPYHYPDTTMIAEGSLGDGAAAAVVFTLEGIRGGTDYLQYMSMFWKRGGHYVFCCTRRVGGKGIRSVESVTFSGGNVHLTGKEYVAGTDAMCCPSKPYAADLIVQGSQLVDATARTSNNRWSGP